MTIPFQQIEQEQEDETDFETTFVETILPDEEDDFVEVDEESHRELLKIKEQL